MQPANWCAAIEERGIGVGELAPVARRRSASPLDAAASRSRRRAAGVAGARPRSWSTPPTVRAGRHENAPAARSPAAANGVSRSVDDRIVVARVERDIAAAALDERRDDVERAVAVERRDLDRDDALDVEKAAPEVPIEHAPADRGLKVEPDHRNDLGHARGSARAWTRCSRREVPPGSAGRRRIRATTASSASATACAVSPQTPAIITGRGAGARAPVAHRAAREFEDRLEAVRPPDRGSRTVSCARRRRCHRRPRRSSTASVPACRRSSSRRAAVSASGWAGMTWPSSSAPRSADSASVRTGHQRPRSEWACSATARRCATQCATHSRSTFERHLRRAERLRGTCCESLSSATGPSLFDEDRPARRTHSPNQSAASRTEIRSGPVTFRTAGGVEQRSRLRSA